MTINLIKQDIISMCNYINSNQLEKLESFVLFLGHAHSGHSIIGALIDAHKDAAIANEINIPKLLLDHDLDALKLKKVTLASSLNKVKWTSEINTGYKYKIKDGFQGETMTPKVLGDKKGGGSTRVIRNNPLIINKLIDLFGNKLKIIHVIRNPFDNIAAFSHYWNEPLGQKHIDRYFENIDTIFSVKKLIAKTNWVTIQHDAFIKNPSYEMTKLYQFLDLDFDDQLIKNYTSIVRSKVNKRKNQYEWQESFINQIESKSKKYGLL